MSYIFVHMHMDMLIGVTDSNAEKFWAEGNIKSSQSSTAGSNRGFPACLGALETFIFLSAWAAVSSS